MFQRENLINKNVAEGLETTSPRSPRFCIQPELHKQDNPGRLVINSVNCHTSNISKHVEYHLQPIVNMHHLIYKIQVIFYKKSSQ